MTYKWHWKTSRWSWSLRIPGSSSLGCRLMLDVHVGDHEPFFSSRNTKWKKGNLLGRLLKLLNVAYKYFVILSKKSVVLRAVYWTYKGNQLMHNRCCEQISSCYNEYMMWSKKQWFLSLITTIVQNAPPTGRYTRIEYELLGTQFMLRTTDTNESLLGAKAQAWKYHPDRVKMTGPRQGSHMPSQWVTDHREVLCILRTINWLEKQKQEHKPLTNLKQSWKQYLAKRRHALK